MATLGPKLSEALFRQEEAAKENLFNKNTLPAFHRHTNAQKIIRLDGYDLEDLGAHNATDLATRGLAPL